MTLIPLCDYSQAVLITVYIYGIKFSSPFIARKPPNNRNKLCVFFIIRQSQIFL